MKMGEVVIIKNDLLKLFNFENHEVRIVMKENEPWFVLLDLCVVLDLAPRVVRQRLNDDVCSTYPIPDSLGRDQETTIVNEDGLYDVVLDSRKPKAKEFRKWVTGDILPSIRKHGMYAMDELLDNPELLIQTATKLKEERQLRLAAENEILVLKPKAENYDEFLNTEGLIQMNEINKILGIGLKKYYAILRIIKVLMKQKGSTVHIPMETYMGNKGLFVVLRESFIDKKGKKKYHTVTYATHQGAEFVKDSIIGYLGKPAA